MRYQSNLTAPDLAPYFRLLDPPMLTCWGAHDMPSDPDFLPACGFMTHDEAAILYHCAKAWPKRWVDIGARLGWSGRHLIAGGADVDFVDPEYKNHDFKLRLMENCSDVSGAIYPCNSEQYFSAMRSIRAACIDGCHDAPEPTLDAVRAINVGANVLVWHDFQGQPVRDAVAAIMAGYGWRARVYWTPNGMAVAWRDGCGFVPPTHVPDPLVDWREIQRRMSDFDFSRVE
jgi:hypothetical protein